MMSRTEKVSIFAWSIVRIARTMPLALVALFSTACPKTETSEPKAFAELTTVTASVALVPWEPIDPGFRGCEGG